jgi:hypothetical protein
VSSFSKSFIYSGKQGGGATVLGEGCDIITGETCDPYSLNVNSLGKAAVLHFALAHFCGWGRANSAYKLFGIAVLMSSSHRLVILHSPHTTACDTASHGHLLLISWSKYCADQIG